MKVEEVVLLGALVFTYYILEGRVLGNGGAIILLFK